MKASEFPTSPPSADPQHSLLRWGPAAMAAFSAHAALIVLAALLKSGPPVLEDSHSVAVTLVSSAPASGFSAPSPKSAASSLERLQAQLSDTLPSRAPSTAPQEANRLTLSELDALTTFASRGTSLAPSNPSGNSGASDPYAYASLSPSSAHQAVTRSLGDQAARCSRPPPASPAILLRVVLDGRGALVETPRILNSDFAMLDPARIKINADAVTAIRNCAPFIAPPVRTPTAYDVELR